MIGGELKPVSHYQNRLFSECCRPLWGVVVFGQQGVSGFSSYAVATWIGCFGLAEAC